MARNQNQNQNQSGQQGGQGSQAAKVVSRVVDKATRTRSKEEWSVHLSPASKRGFFIRPRASESWTGHRSASLC